ncbi:S-acyl fatty acid synthase thioesterase, medium chain-like [Babylonia areolata]|uniref:S-acyl fatty acid synthase thioesterase, medium chain-like n=1 Tax=Babylonia areolata TaxID=304850 RepID=UPI003FCEFA7A
MTDKLLTCRLQRPEAKVRLICFPWAGAGGSAFTRWPKLLPAHVELLGVTLAGRDNRYKEDCSFSARHVADVIAAAVHSRCSDKPFFFFGHSLGALLCQEVAATLRADYGLGPAHVYVSGESPPHSTTLKRRPKKDYKSMDEESLVKELKKLGCITSNVLENRELLAIYLPAFRADLTLVDQIVYDIPCRLKATPLPCPVTVLEALEDDPFDIQGWKTMTTGEFRVKQVAGGHFYMKDPFNEKLLCDLIAADAEAYVNSP